MDITYLETVFKHLDPSLFVNVIIGVLAIFIPFAIVFLTDILNSKEEKRSEFEKMVLNDEVLETTKIFWLAIIGIIFFSFFSGKDTSLFAKLVSVCAALIFALLFWSPFKKALRFSENYKSEFEIAFLKKLKLSKLFRFKNKIMAEKMFRAWNSFWSEKSEINETDFTNIFISHIEDSIGHDDLNLAIKLSQTYVNNIEKREGFIVSYDILPKVFKWNETFWHKQQQWLKFFDTEKRIQELISQKNFPTFRNWILQLHKKTHTKRERFWNWNYFGGEFFQVIIKLLLKGGHEPYQLFSSFKEHIEECERRLDEIQEKEKKEKYWKYITSLFSSFYPIFFDEIDNAPINYSIWEHYFPPDWKITASNKDSNIARITLHEFIQWSRNRIFVKSDTENIDKDLTEVINGIFPHVHSSLFTAFLMLFFSNEVMEAIERKPNFYITGTIITWSGPIEESKETRDKRITDMMNANEASQKKETIRVIFEFFGPRWRTITAYKENFDTDDLEKWDNYTEAQRLSIVKKVKKEKLEKVKVEIKSDKIKEACKGSELKESYRKNMEELIELLIKEVKE